MNRRNFIFKSALATFGVIVFKPKKKPKQLQFKSEFVVGIDYAYGEDSNIIIFYRKPYPHNLGQTTRAIS